MNDPQRFNLSALCGLLGIVLLMAGCGGSSQDPDPVVVDKPIAYIKRPVSDTATGSGS